jgi:hypothetical protein
MWCLGSEDAAVFSTPAQALGSISRNLQEIGENASIRARAMLIVEMEKPWWDLGSSPEDGSEEAA